MKTILEYFSRYSDLTELHIRRIGCSVSVVRRSSDGDCVSAIGFGDCGDNEIYDEYGKNKRDLKG
ncbi:MAG: hypothetical protein K2O89_01365 [Clostridia bacterium]|nr:hypothetical protein [Clostridia bacterium]